MTKVERLYFLIEEANQFTRLYDKGTPAISDQEYDDIYFEIARLEDELNVHPINSPINSISFDVVSALNKVEHGHKMLSLEKTKDIEIVKSFLGDREFIAMCKMDGLTCSLTYEKGILVKAETRGNGLIGEDVLHNAKHIKSIPQILPTAIDMVVDGEIICTYNDFAEFASSYKNPRNFAAGSIRLLDANECAKRNLTFVAWDMVEGCPEIDSFQDRLLRLTTMDFVVVPWFGLDFEECCKALPEKAKAFGYPIDGLVFKFDSVSYGRSLGETAHHFKNAIAFKFYDETVESKLRDISWDVGRTGVLTPVAIFNPVEIEGSVVERASLHNVSVMRETLGEWPYEGQVVGVIKANMIIPQISYAERKPELAETLFAVPITCPICGGTVRVIDNDGVQIAVCDNPSCEGKFINILEHFCSKKGLDIKGLSKATLEKLVDWSWVEKLSDIMTLSNHRAEWIKKPSFGPKSVDKILDAIEAAKNTSLESFISSLGIPLIGQSVAKELVKKIPTYEEFRSKINERFNFAEYEGFAESKTTALWEFNYDEADVIYGYLNIAAPKEESKGLAAGTLKDLKVVITGKLTEFKNRDAFKSCIEAHGGKVVDSVSKNTNYLINNDVNSTSSKNKSAQKLGIPILSEKEFIEKFALNS